VVVEADLDMPIRVVADVVDVIDCSGDDRLGL
jgi:hypothetical protein